MRICCPAARTDRRLADIRAIRRQIAQQAFTKPPTPSFVLSADRATTESPMPRELIDTGTDKRFVRPDEEGRFEESDDVGRSLAADRRQKPTTTSKKGEGDKGDR